MAEPTREMRLSDNRVSYTMRSIGRLEGAAGHDVYHALISMPGLAVFGIMVGLYFALNAAFAAGFLAIGGLGGAEPGSFVDAFFFSVQTMATIGYGVIHPVSRAANWLVVSESVVGIIYTAVATGLVFVRFSRIRGRVVFSKKATISPMDGVPTLALRVGNGRGNRIYDAEFRLMLTRTQRTPEASSLYKTEDLKLVRSHAPTLGRSWMMLHRIDETSPLFHETPESMAAVDAEVLAAVSGLDATALQPVHGRYTWENFDIAWGARLADVLSENGNELILNLDRFHDIEPTKPTATFDYPKKSA
jgi:inward rectifier potassium channel